MGAHVLCTCSALTHVLCTCSALTPCAHPMCSPHVLCTGAKSCCFTSPETRIDPTQFHTYECTASPFRNHPHLNILYVLTYSPSILCPGAGAVPKEIVILKEGGARQTKRVKVILLLTFKLPIYATPITYTHLLVNRARSSLSCTSNARATTACDWSAVIHRKMSRTLRT